MPDKLTDTRAAETPNDGTFTVTYCYRTSGSWLTRAWNRLRRGSKEIHYTTRPIDSKASAADVQAAIEEVSGAPVVVTGPDGGPYTVQHRA